MQSNSSYKILKNCRFCGNSDLKNVLNLGKMPLAGGFLKKNDIDLELFFPLELQYCNKCHLVQVSCVPNPNIIFNEKYFFHSSSTNSLIEHFSCYAKDIFQKYLKNIIDPIILEIGCNDGVLLKPLASLGCKVIGVDPSSSVTNKIDIDNSVIINDFFTENLSLEILNNCGSVDIVTANFAFAHIDDMHDVMKGIVNLLKKDGVFVFELYYLKTVIEEMNYDMIYHEHMSYYSLITLREFLSKYEMDIFDIDYFPKLRSGALRIHAKFKSNLSLKITEKFTKALNLEYDFGLNTINPFYHFSEKIEKTKLDLIRLIIDLKSQGKKIVGYGASGRSTILMNYCGITSEHIDCVVDDAVEKQGFLTPGNHLEILTWENMLKVGKPDYIILFAWSFTDEVLIKRASFREKGGKFILPLPNVKVI